MGKKPKEKFLKKIPKIFEKNLGLTPTEKIPQKFF